MLSVLTYLNLFNTLTNMNLPIYLDNNATTPLDPRVLETMMPYLSHKFGNASSKSHIFGWTAEEAVNIARQQTAQLIGAEENEIIFTSGATESINLAIKGVFEAYQGKGNHIITAVTEHKAVLDTCRRLEKSGAEVTYLRVNSDGLIDLQQLEQALRDKTILTAIMYANNETGVIQPIKEIAEIVHQHGSLFFTDAAQAAGKIPVNIQKDGIDILAVSGHKMYGPKGVGALYVRRRNPRVRIAAQIDGGGHERGMRSGTLNVPGIAGLGRACELCRMEMEAESKRLSALRDKLENSLLEIERTMINGSRKFRLPHVMNMTFKKLSGERLMIKMKDIALSSGSACTSGSPEPSYVLKSLGLSDEDAHASLRFGLGRFTTAEEIDYVIEQVKKTTAQAKASNSAFNY